MGVIENHEHYFQTVISNLGGIYLNYSKDINLNSSDFADITHLNLKGSDKFSELLNLDILNYLKK